MKLAPYGVFGLIFVITSQFGWAILAQGPAAGTPVVINGAAELLGTEFGALSTYQ